MYAIIEPYAHQEIKRENTSLLLFQDRTSYHKESSENIICVCEHAPRGWALGDGGVLFYDHGYVDICKLLSVLANMVSQRWTCTKDCAHE